MSDLKNFIIVIIFAASCCCSQIYAAQIDSFNISIINDENVIYEDNIIDTDSINTWAHNIVCNGDTIAYSKIIHHVPYWDVL